MTSTIARRAAALVALVALALGLAACGSTADTAAPAQHPNAQHQLPSTTSTTTITSPPSVVLKVTGSEPAMVIRIEVPDDAGDREAQYNDVPLPWSQSVPMPSLWVEATTDPRLIRTILTLDAESASGSESASVSCEIDSPGAAPVTNTSTGPYAAVDCTSNGS
jgi:hypothetical protein